MKPAYDKEMAANNVGDYGGTVHVSEPQAKQAIQAAESFLNAVKSLLSK